MKEILNFLIEKNNSIIPVFGQPLHKHTKHSWLTQFAKHLVSWGLRMLVCRDTSWSRLSHCSHLSHGIDKDGRCVWRVLVDCKLSGAFRNNVRPEWGTSQIYSNLTTDRIQRHQIWVWFRSMVNLWTHNFGDRSQPSNSGRRHYFANTAQCRMRRHSNLCQRPSGACSSDGDVNRSDARRSRVCEAGLQTRSCAVQEHESVSEH
jgi:hypothetical protein